MNKWSKINLFMNQNDSKTILIYQPLNKKKITITINKSVD